MVEELDRDGVSRGGARQEAAFLCRPMFANGLPRHPMPSTQEGQHC